MATLSETVFHLACMQAREERDAAECREAAARRNIASGLKKANILRAENHEARASALGVAIGALVPLP